MTATASSWWTVPRPRHYLPNPVAVSALHYDGSDTAQVAIRQWLRRSAPCAAPARIRLIDQASLLLELPSADPVRVLAGEFLVHRRDGDAGRWSSWSAARFHDRYQVLPLELPIFDDGETP